MGLNARALPVRGTSRFPEFKSITVEDKTVLVDYTDQFSTLGCEYSFANLYAWNHLYQFSWCVHKERLLIHDNGSDYLLMPVGEPFDPDELADISRALRQMGKSGNIALVPQDYVDGNPGLGNVYQITYDRDFADYIYCVRKLSELKGSKLQKKKNLISQFHRLYPHARVEIMNRDLREKSLKLNERILKTNREINLTIREEQSAIREAFRNFDAIGMEGLVVSVGQDPVAFSVFSRLNRFMYDVHFEKSDLAFKGAAQVINHETALHLSEKCEYINREQDLGLAGLRQAKLSYEPELVDVTAMLTFLPESGQE
ncbi:MAG: phosphatidylglycerol lysyltransferase domain-containing protein [Pseudomonadota bacterium]